MGTVAIGRVLDAGVNVISHGFYLNRELAQRMAEQNVYLDPHPQFLRTANHQSPA
jgi:hypothetical protein